MNKTILRNFFVGFVALVLFVSCALISNAQTTTGRATVVATSTSCSNLLNRSLTVGKVGTDVLTLHNFLKDRGYFTGIPSTRYTAETKEAVKAFQKAYGVSVTGYVAVETRALINKINCGSISACSSFTYSAWSACSSSGNQTRTVVSRSPAGCVGGSPILSQSCTVAPSAEVTLISTGLDVDYGNGIDSDSVLGTFKFKIYAIGGDLKVASTTNGDILKIDKSGVEMLTNNLPVVIKDLTEIETDGGYYLIEEGESETFEINFHYTPSSSGLYNFTLKKIPLSSGAISLAGRDEFESEYIDLYYRPTPTCSSFTYTPWSACSSSGNQTRTVVSRSPAGCVGGSPILSQSCTVQAPLCTYTFSDWSPCSNDGIQTRTVVSKSPDNCLAVYKILKQKCTVEVTNTACGEPLVDSRDNHSYRTVQIGSQCWMAENLNVGKNDGKGNGTQTNNSIIEKFCVYGYGDADCSKYGGFYQWNEAMNYTTTSGVQGICPTGWHIPTSNEFKTLEKYLGMSEKDASSLTKNVGGLSTLLSFRGTDQGTKLKKGGNSGFDAIMAGVGINQSTGYGFGTYASFWTSTDGGGSAFFRALDSSTGSVNIINSFSKKDYSMSIRCIKNTNLSSGGADLNYATASVNWDAVWNLIQFLKK